MAALRDAMQRVKDEAGSGPGFGALHKRNGEAADNLKVVDQVNRKDRDQCEDEGVNLKVHLPSLV